MTEVLSHHTDVVCPPDPNATCKHCGAALEHHQPNDDPDAPITPDNAVCLDDAALLHRRVVWNVFELADGETLDCPGVTFCDQCHADLCADHSTEFATCVDSAHNLHHFDCREQCTPCMRAVWEDAAEDRAIEIWKGL